MRPLIIIIFFFACSTESVKLDSTGHSSEIVIVSNASTENNEQIEKLEQLRFLENKFRIGGKLCEAIRGEINT